MLIVGDAWKRPRSANAIQLTRDALIEKVSSTSFLKVVRQVFTIPKRLHLPREPKYCMVQHQPMSRFVVVQYLVTDQTLSRYQGNVSQSTFKVSMWLVEGRSKFIVSIYTIPITNSFPWFISTWNTNRTSEETINWYRNFCIKFLDVETSITGTYLPSGNIVSEKGRKDII